MSESPGPTAPSGIPTSRSLRRRIALGVVLLFAFGSLVWINTGQTPARMLQQGLAAVDVGDATTVERLRSKLEASGHPGEAAVLQGTWLVRRQRYPEALSILPPEMLDGPHRLQVMRLVGESLFRIGDFTKAELLLARLTQESSREVEAHRILAAMYYDLGANNLVLRELEAVERLAPADYRPHHLAGMIHADGEDFSAAVADFRHALDKKPPTAVAEELVMELARVLVRNRQYEAAQQELKTAPDTLQRSVLLSECAWSLGDLPRAAELVESVLARDAQNADALRLQARLLEESGNLPGAIQALKQLLNEEPYDVESRYLLVQLLGSSGQTRERDQQQVEYLRWRKLHDRLIELNLKANEEPDAVAPRRELVSVCRELGRERLAEMWQRSADYCEQRAQARQAGPDAAAKS